MSVLNNPCLVLNKHWQPVAFLPVKTCIVAVIADAAAVICPVSYSPMSFEQWVENPPENVGWIKSSSGEIPAPAVIVLKYYGGQPPRYISFNRPNLYKRDHYSCQYCGAVSSGRKLQMEHILPRSRGGKSSWTNCVAACGPCNSRKSNRTPKEAGMRLLRAPVKPKWRPRLTVPTRYYNTVWGQFLAKERVA